jgi:hypothetical protein
MQHIPTPRRIQIEQHGNDATRKVVHLADKKSMSVRTTIAVSSDPVNVKSGPVDMEIPALTFTWNVKAGDALHKALRPYIHEELSGLPAHHFLAIEGEIGRDLNVDPILTGLKITVIVPEK